MNDSGKQFDSNEGGLSRRTIVKGAAWSLPVIAVAVSTPAMAASGVDVGAFTLNGTCGVLGVVGPGFLLSSADEPLPAGTTISITGSGIADIGIFTSDDIDAGVAVLTPTSRQITLNEELPANSTVAFRTTLSIDAEFALVGVAALPTGYTATGAKTVGTVDSTAVLCSAG